MIREKDLGYFDTLVHSCNLFRTETSKVVGKGLILRKSMSNKRIRGKGLKD